MNLATCSEADLFAIMAARSVSPGDARAAWEELFVRHRRYLYAVISRAYGGFLMEDGVTDLVVDTFRRAYEWAGTQTDPEAVRARFSSDGHDATRRRVLGWLGAIAERLFKDRFRDGASQREAFRQFVEEWKGSQDRPPAEIQPCALAPLQDALAELGQAEADALRLSLPWYDSDSRSFALPRGEASRIAASLGVAPDTFRQQRHRALKKIEAHLRGAGWMDSVEEAVS